MGNKTEVPSFNLTDYKIFSDEINNLHWKDFEQFVINVFKKVFDASEVQIKQTKYSHDGGKDGEGIFNIMQNKDETDFSIQIKIWIEVKKRSGKVTGSDIGIHVLTAFLNKVSFIIFASNSSFAPQAKATLALLSDTHNINHDFVDGERLFKLYQKHSQRNISEAGTKNKFGQPIETCFNTNFSFSKRPLKRYSKKSIDVEIDEPFYIFIDFDFTNCSIKSIGNYKLHLENIQLIPYDISPLIHTLRLNTKTTHIWVGYPKKSLSNPIIKLIFSNQQNRDDIKTSLKINVQEPLFTFKSPASITLKIDRINHLLIDWFKKGTYKSTIIYGNAGTGKSYLVNQFRYLWLHNNVSEIILDGEIENSESVLLNRFIQDVFPFPIGLLGEEQENDVFDFLIDCQLSSKSARKLANSICSKKEINVQEFSSDVLSDLLYFLIKKKSEQRKTIIVYEDIHKCQPSVILLLIKTHRRLIHENIRDVFLLLCSRKSASFKNQEALRDWLLYVENILEDQNIEQVKLEPYTLDEASSIIQDIVFSISEIDTLKIIDQVGTTPFGLKEALFYMYQKDWIEYDSKIDQFLLKEISFHRLRAAIKSNVFTQVTKTRISELKLQIPKWASIFIDAGACQGTSFNKEWCFEILESTVDETEISNFLTLSSKLGILKNSNLHSDYLKFDHDLIRASLLNDIEKIRLRELSSRLFEIIPDDPINYKQKAFLAFQAGIPKDVEFYSESYGDMNVKKEIYEDALEAYKMTLYVIDKNMITGSRFTNTSLWFIDEALTMAKENQIVLELPIDIRNQKIISLCKKIVDTANRIGSGSQAIVKTFITEGLILAKILNDHQSLGIFHIRQGVLLFEKNDLDKSIDEFQKALNYLPLSDYHNRGHALVELAISQRHAGKYHESFITLKQALKEAGNKDFEIKLRVFANAGSLYFNTDWKYTRKYWHKALKVAESWGAVNYWTHMLIDIGHLNLLDNCFEEANRYYQLAYEKAQSSGLKSQEFKIQLHRSILTLAEKGDNELQLLYSEALLKQAESLGIMYSIDRKLWRVYANWANVTELKAQKMSNRLPDEINQLWRLAYTYDKKAISEFKEAITSQNNNELINNRRVIPILVNTYLRSLDPNYPNQELLELIDTPVLTYVKSISNLVLKNNLDQIPPNIIKFVKPLLGNYRFVFT